MKAKIKSGGELLFTAGCSNDWRSLKEDMIINFRDKYTYVSFKQKRNHLYIKTTDGEVDIVFCGEVPKLVFDSFCKDQLILRHERANIETA